MTPSIRQRFPITGLVAAIVGFSPPAVTMYLHVAAFQRNQPPVELFNHWVILPFVALGIAGLLTFDGMPLNVAFLRLADAVKSVFSRGSQREDTDEHEGRDA